MSSITKAGARGVQNTARVVTVCDGAAGHTETAILGVNVRVTERPFCDPEMINRYAEMILVG